MPRSERNEGLLQNILICMLVLTTCNLNVSNSKVIIALSLNLAERVNLRDSLHLNLRQIPLYIDVCLEASKNGVAPKNTHDMIKTLLETTSIWLNLYRLSGKLHTTEDELLIKYSEVVLVGSLEYYKDIQILSSSIYKKLNLKTQLTSYPYVKQYCDLLAISSVLLEKETGSALYNALLKFYESQNYDQQSRLGILKNLFREEVRSLFNTSLA